MASTPRFFQLRSGTHSGKDLNEPAAPNPDGCHPNPRLLSEDLHAYQHNQPTTFDRNAVVKFCFGADVSPYPPSFWWRLLYFSGWLIVRPTFEMPVLDSLVQASLSAATSAINDGRTADAYRSLELIPLEQRDVAWEPGGGDLQQSTLLRTERAGNTEGR